MTSDVPNCEGFTRPIRVVAPIGTVVNPRPPAACGARGITGFRMIDCLFGALAQAVPERVAADGSGGSSLPTFAGWQQDRPFVFSETLMGNWGGTRSHDGQEGVAHMGANQSNVPIELIELDYPLRIERYGLEPDTGGPGKHRGGLAIRRDYRILADDTMVSIRSDKRAYPPHGLLGGRPGTPSMTIVNPGGADERPVPVLVTDPLTLQSGDLFSHLMAGAGGYGDPFERDPEAVRGDVVLGKVSPARAREVLWRRGDRGRGRPRAHRLGRDPAAARRRRCCAMRIVLSGGEVHDGSGGPPVSADLLIEDGRIGALGHLGPVADAIEIDARGCVVAPGFIDIHSHSDFTLLVDPRAVSAIAQGVTTEVIGNCGYGCAPIGDPALAREVIYGFSEEPPLTWHDLDGYLERLDQARPAVNVAALVPNGQLRLATVGLAQRPADDDERAAMLQLLAQAMEQGAFGYSTGLEYATECGASEQEVTELCRVAAAAGGIYATHTRNRDEAAVEAVAEAVRIAEATGARLQVSHITPRGGPRGHGAGDRAGRPSAGARARCRIRHAHPDLRHDLSQDRAAALGVRGRAQRLARAPLLGRSARPHAAVPQPDHGARGLGTRRAAGPSRYARGVAPQPRRDRPADR